jgi:hypothetical protein
MDRTTSTSTWALVAVIVGLSTSAQAQELRRDSVWNGVVAGAAVGGGLGLVVAKTTKVSVRRRRARRFGPSPAEHWDISRTS